MTKNTIYIRDQQNLQNDILGQTHLLLPKKKKKKLSRISRQTQKFNTKFRHQTTKKKSTLENFFFLKEMMMKNYQSPVLGCLLIEGTSRVGAKSIPLYLCFSSSVQLSSLVIGPGCWAFLKLCMSPTVCQSKQFWHSTENSV